MRDPLGQRDEIIDAERVATLVRGMLDSVGGPSHPPVTLDPTLTNVLTIDPGSQLLEVDATITQGALVNGADQAGTVVLSWLAIGTNKQVLQSDGSDPGWATLTIEDFGDIAYAVPSITFSDTAAEGNADSMIRSNAVLAAFDDGANPDDWTLTAAPGTDAFAARRDHVHAPDLSVAPTWTGVHTHEATFKLDGTADDSPFLQFITLTNDDTVSVFLNENVGAGTSDLTVRLCDAAGASKFQIQDDSPSVVAWIDSNGAARFWDTVTLDDGATDSPALNFVGGSNNDAISLFLLDDAGAAGDSDLVVELADAVGDSALLIRDSGSNLRAWVNSDGESRFWGTMTLDDDSGDSPDLNFVGGSNNDTISVFLNDDAGDANYSDLCVKLLGTAGNSQFQIMDSGENIVVRLNDAGGGTFEQGVIINNEGVDSDTRIEGNNETNLLFVDAGNDRVYIGTNAVDANFSGHQTGIQVHDRSHLISNDTVSAYTAICYSAASWPTFRGRRAQGTRASIDAVDDGDILGRFGGAGYDGVAWPTADNSFMQSIASEDFTPGNWGSHLAFYTTDEGSGTRDFRMIIDHNGWVGIGGITHGNVVSLLHVHDGALTVSHASAQPTVNWLDDTDADWFSWAFNRASDDFSLDSNSLVNIISVEKAGSVGINTDAPGSLMEWNFATDNLEFVDADDSISSVSTITAAIEVQVGGVTCYVPCYTTAS